MKRKPLALYCFSPPVMIATFFIELALAAWTLWHYKANEVGKLVLTVLLLLATFQLAEYNVCASGWIDPMLASRIGYAAITLLPALGLHLAYALAGVKKRPIVVPAYVLAGVFDVFFLFTGNALIGHACLSNYAIFQMVPGSAMLYGWYYNGLLVVGMALSAWLARHVQAKQVVLTGYLIGYLVFFGANRAGCVD